MSLTTTILEEIRVECGCQNDRCTVAFDKKNTLNDLVAFVNICLAEASVITASPVEQREGILKAAIVLVMAIESFDRNGEFAPRYYEDQVPDDDPEFEPEFESEFESKSDKSQFDSLQDEITIARVAVEQLLNSMETDENLIQRIPTLSALILTIDRLVRTASQLKSKMSG